MKWYIKLLLLLMIVLPVGAVVAMIGSKPSYLLIGYDNSILETNLSFAFLVLLVVTVVGLLVFYLLYKGVFWSRQFITWKRERKLKYANFQTKAGVLALAEGKWQLAEKQFRSALANHDEQLMAYLGAARAANKMKRYSDRDQYLEKARTCIAGSELAAGITLAELQLDSGQFDQCLATLKALQRKSASSPQALKLLQQVYLKLQDWQSLIDLLPRFKKYEVISDEEFSELEKTLYVNRLKSIAEEKRALVNDENRAGFVNDLVRVWESKPNSLNQDSDVLRAFVEALITLGADQKAEAVLSKNLTAYWADELVLLYAQLNADLNKQITQARGWLQQHPDSDTLQLCLGRLLMKAGDKEAAKEHFEASLKLRKSFDAYKELGKLFASQGELGKSNEYLLLSIA